MQYIAIIVGFVVAISAGILLSLAPALSATWKAEQDKERERRLYDAKMNARLLRFNL